MRPSTSKTGCTAGRMSSEWKAPATGRRTARVLRSFAAASSRSIAGTDPLTTDWAGELRFATTNSSSPRTSAHSASASSAPTPSRAVIAPGRSSPARCMAAPRIRTSSSASDSATASAATSAANSPSECPATPTTSVSPSAWSTRNAATSQANRAGWTNAVVASASSSRHPSAIERPSAVDASSSTACPAGCFVPGVRHPDELRPLPRKHHRVRHATQPTRGATGGEPGPSGLSERSERGKRSRAPPVATKCASAMTSATPGCQGHARSC